MPTTSPHRPHRLAAVPIRVARWSARHPGRAIGGWLAFVAVALGLAMMVPTQQTTDADYEVGDSGRAAALVRDAGLDGHPSEDVLITARHGRLDPTAANEVAGEVVAGMKRLPEVASVAAPRWSKDRSALLVDVEVTGRTEDDEDVGALQEVTRAVQAHHPDLRVREAGEISVNNAINDRVGDDLSSAEGTSLPLTLVLMLLAFGALIAAGIPVLVAATSVAATIGLMAPLSHLVHAESTVSSVIVLIGMAVGVDYSLFYLKREREEREAGRGTLDAVEVAARTSGHSIVVSGLAVIAAMAGLYVAGGVTFNSIATGSILVVAVAVLGSITVLPALLARLGRWVYRPRVPLLWRLNRRIGRGGISSRVVRPVLRHPAAALVLGGVVVAALAAPTLGMTVHEANLDTLPRDIPQVQTWRAMGEAFPSEAGTATVVVKAPAAKRAEVRTALLDVQDAAIRTPDYTAGITDPIEVSRDGTVSVLHLAMRYQSYDSRADTAVEHLRALVPSKLDPVLDGAGEAVVGGDVATSYDATHQIRDRLPLVVGVVLLLTMLMMGSAFRSVPVALLSTALNLASVGVAFGLLTVVFQHGVFAGPLDFTSPGFVIDWLPLFVLVVLVGLSMDYHVFVVSRIREHVRAGLPTRVAVERGVVDTAGVVTSAAVVMVSVFSLFATLSMMEMKMIGVGLAGAILLDATLIRLVMLPAALVLLGDRAWWPRRPRRPLGRRVVETEPAYELV
jgi:RND superfamily putative drug exporter